MKRSLLLLLWCSTPSYWAADQSSIEIGHGNLDGHVLFSELNCAACHNPGAAKDHIAPKPAPNLSVNGRSLPVSWIREYLLDPQKLKPGTTMPSVLGSLEGAEKNEAADALAHFLRAKSKPAENTPPKYTTEFSAASGESIFHSVGCVACHSPTADPRTDDADTGKGDRADGLNIPLGLLGKKYTANSLAQFLLDPLASHPSGRMPSLGLSEMEAASVSAYLLRDQPLEKGEELFRPGWAWALFEGQWSDIPDFSKLTPITSGVTKRASPNEAYHLDGKLDSKNPRGYFGMRFQGTAAIDKDGTYRFKLRADDRAALRLDGKVVANTEDGKKKGEIEVELDLKKGSYELVIDYVQTDGNFSCDLEWIAPGGEAGKWQRVEDKVVSHRVPQRQSPLDSEFKPDPKKVEKGKSYYTSMRCANCHSNPKEEMLAAPALADINPGSATGCLSVNRKDRSPDYTLSDAQRKSLIDTVKELKDSKGEPKPELVVARTMKAFNCYACHERGGMGGATTGRNPYFSLCITADLGDEGRLPPKLDKAGAKFTRSGLEQVFGGTRIRPYMATRMPGFGTSNLNKFADSLIAADKGTIPTHTPDVTGRMVERGKTLAGAEGVACITCHKWGGNNSLGVPGPDLVDMPKRLDPAWFHAWLKDPHSLSPGTRMPAFWPNGTSPFPDLLEGDSTKQMDAIWAYLAAGTKAGAPEGMNSSSKKPMEIGERTVVFRTFVDQVSAHAITVGNPSGVHFVFDANRVRMHTVWIGDFVSASPAWDGRAGQYAGIPSNDQLRFPSSPPFARLGSPETPWPADKPKPKTGNDRTPEGYHFLGYRLDKAGNPTFRYRIAPDIEVEESAETEPLGKGAGITRRFKVTAKAAEGNEWAFLIGSAGEIEEKGDGFVLDGYVRVSVQDAPESPFIRETSERKELILPLPKLGPKDITFSVRTEW